jgi:periplasmic protein TonB
LAISCALHAVVLTTAAVLGFEVAAAPRTDFTARFMLAVPPPAVPDAAPEAQVVSEPEPLPPLPPEPQSPLDGQVFPPDAPGKPPPAPPLPSAPHREVWQARLVAPQPEKMQTPPLPVAPVASSAPAQPASIVEARPLAANLPPVYPLDALRAGQQGTVLVELDIDAQGSVSAAHVLMSSGWPSLDSAALESLRRWHFHPGTENGVPAASKFKQPVQFHLRRGA